MKELSTLIKLSALLVIGGGTVGAAVGITEAQTAHEDIVENNDMVHAVDEETKYFTNRKLDEELFYFDITEATHFETEGDIAVYFFEGDGTNGSNKWTNILKPIEKDSYYYAVNIPSGGWKKCSIVEINSGKEPSWNQKKNQTNDIDISSVGPKKCIKITDFNSGKYNTSITNFVSPTNSGLISGETVYVDTTFFAHEKVLDWQEEGAKIGIIFWAENYISQGSKFMTNVSDVYSSFDKLVTCNVPYFNDSAILWTNCAVIRFKPSKEEPVNWDHGNIWGRSINISLNVAEHANVIYLGNFSYHDDNGYDVYEYTLSNIGLYDEALNWGAYFIDETNKVCDFAGTDKGITDLWKNTLAGKFNSYPKSIKDLVKECNANESGSIIEKANARYKYIVNKYLNIEDFIGDIRTVPLKSNTIVSDKNTSSLIIATSILGISSIAMAGFVFLNKKKRPLIK